MPSEIESNPIPEPARRVRLDDRIRIGAGRPLLLIAGPCVIEDEGTTVDIARHLEEVAQRVGLPLLFKASFDKANRTSIEAYRGPGIERGLAVLETVRSRINVAVISDVHDAGQVDEAASVLDVIQVPAFLCRQTDLLVAAAKTGKPLNIKKGQFLAPWDMANVVAKANSVGNQRLLLTERGAMFGYNNLVVDFRSIRIMQSTGCPVIFDATHSVQLPGGAGTASGGQREFAPILAAAAVAAGADGVFMEVHPDPDRARCDGPNSLPLQEVEPLLKRLQAVRQAVDPGAAA
jgi:2-dehydro-3-deoxyphosphooctonate aldolase (KDO 8-P synthase)